MTTVAMLSPTARRRPPDRLLVAFCRACGSFPSAGLVLAKWVDDCPKCAGKDTVIRVRYQLARRAPTGRR